jgi:hypothetical protein
MLIEMPNEAAHLWACTVAWLIRNVSRRVALEPEEVWYVAVGLCTAWPFEWPLVVVETAASIAMIMGER